MRPKAGAGIGAGAAAGGNGWFSTAGEMSCAAVVPSAPPAGRDEPPQASSRAESVRVLACDRLPVVRDGLRTMVESAPDLELVGTADDGTQAYALVRRLRPDVVVTDVSLPGMSGIELTRRLTGGVPQVRARVLVFTQLDDDQTVLASLEAGASGFLVKGASSVELLAAVRAVAQGEAALEPRVARRLLDWFFCRRDRPPATLSPAVLSLTSREREVLQLMATGMSSAEIASMLSVGVATVRSHTYHLRRKLDLKDRAQVVSFAYRSGLRLPVG